MDASKAIDAAQRKANEAKSAVKSRLFSLCAPCLSLAGMGDDAGGAGGQARPRGERDVATRETSSRADAEGEKERREVDQAAKQREKEEAAMKKEEEQQAQRGWVPSPATPGRWAFHGGAAERAAPHRWS